MPDAVDALTEKASLDFTDEDAFDAVERGAVELLLSLQSLNHMGTGTSFRSSAGVPIPR